MKLKTIYPFVQGIEIEADSVEELLSTITTMHESILELFILFTWKKFISLVSMAKTYHDKDLLERQGVKEALDYYDTMKVHDPIYVFGDIDKRMEAYHHLSVLEDLSKHFTPFKSDPFKNS